ncbi:endonuclease/exonuclease/phosphatase family protein [Lacimicrobium alkaliphilum]|uniref:Endonuclease/exonuclease/phosphatase domain-containing protein n=1 Tax=Lacimicrobium alkaliphilum TaxID=1526571 RepID=A0A0U2ZA52_9ALTE|nr:endonuclease/exonuclease/phosphatase family protein [Lacimicrobium alkaliphilum]ALS99795.1 hypothetical protein AT746_17000 [Lacimicrobium alkaliphilum]
MNRAVFILLLVLPVVAGADTLKVESFNLRYDNPDDGINAWPKRREMVITHIQSVKPDILTLQEALAHQLDWLSAQLTDYRCVGVGRDNGKREGEFVPICYRTDKLEALDSGHFWLSDTPNQAGSIGRGAHLPRVTSWIKLKHHPSLKTLTAFNTHFSHVSAEARNKSAEILLEQARKISGQLPIIISGDFNALPAELSYRHLLQNTMLPLQDAASAIAPQPTLNGFGTADPPVRIDYILTSKGFRVFDFDTFQINIEGRYISDHYPIMATVGLP